ncbi:MAG: ATPase, T2SS/T4P/T4SS family [Armatimonadota bacterium]|nr:ATPase, T2SS/T4P/T4SS family [Armatimonadota bacterium]
MQSLLRTRLGDVLVAAGVLTEKQLDWALEQQKVSYKRLGEILLESGLVAEEDIVEARALQMEMPCVDLVDVKVPDYVVRLVPEGIARTYAVVPVYATEDRLALATADPMDVEAIDAVQRVSKRRVEPLLASRSQIESLIDRLYGVAAADDITTSIEQASEEIAVEAGHQDLSTDISEERRRSEEAPVIKAVNLVIQEAIKRRASDIHFEPRADRMEVRYRIDGVLQHVRDLPKNLQGAVISRIKVMADLDIAEKRVPQDGRISVKLNNKSVDLRISTLPVQYGERVVVRILDKSGIVLSLEKLGFSKEDLEAFKYLIERPYGIILVTGPTGSGKTTTLYSALDSIRSPEINIMTVEDPIEYELDGVNQSAVNVKTGLTFPVQLRAILRQDPDVIFVGEIRDRETATIAFQAAMTGHLVFSTLHCNDAASAITRLTDMGVEPFLIGSSIIGVLAQRLVRTLCPRCKEAYEAGADELALLRLSTDETEVKLYKSVGCGHCGGTGFVGRTAVVELMRVNDEIRRLTLQMPTADQIRESAVRAGMKTLRESAVEKVLAGITTLDEARRKVFFEED